MSFVTKTSISAIWEATVGNTGRTVTGNEGHALAAEWAKLGDPCKIRTHAGYDEFRSLGQYAPCLNGSPLSLFRGRRFKDCVPTSQQMGPPGENAHTGGGRYDRPGHPVLYLCNSEEGVRREMGTVDATDTVYVQRFKIPLEVLRIADFRSIPPDHFVSAVFERAEACKVRSDGPKSYAFSQTVAEVVSDHFDGMMVPGVQGDGLCRYCNVVVFKPHPGWIEWLDCGSDPYPLV